MHIIYSYACSFSRIVLFIHFLHSDIPCILVIKLAAIVGVQADTGAGDFTMCDIWMMQVTGAKPEGWPG